MNPRQILQLECPTAPDIGPAKILYDALYELGEFGWTLQTSDQYGTMFAEINDVAHHIGAPVATLEYWLSPVYPQSAELIGWLRSEHQPLPDTANPGASELGLSPRIWIVRKKLEQTEQHRSALGLKLEPLELPNRDQTVRAIERKYGSF